MSMAGLDETMIKTVLTEQKLTDVEYAHLLSTKANITSTNADTVATTANVKMTNALTVAKAKLNAVLAINPFILTAGIMIASMAAIIAIDRKYQQSVQESIDKSKELVTTFNEQQDTFKTNGNVISEISTEYESLSQGVDNFGNNISLTEEEFKRYHEITSQIADMFPTMVQGYDEQGNAILKNKGNVEALTDALKEQRRIANQDILDGSNDMFKGVKNEVSQVIGDINAIDSAIKLLNGGKVTSADTKALELLKKKNIEMNAIGSAQGVTTYEMKNSGTLAEQQRINDAINALMYERNNLLLKQEEVQSRVNVVTQAYLNNSTAYNNLTDAQQNMVSAISSSLNPDNFGYDDKVMQDFIFNSIIIPISQNKDKVNAALTELLTLDSSTMSADAYKSQVDKLINDISKILDVDGVELRVALGVDPDYTSVNSALDELRNKVSGDVFENIKELSGEDLKIAYEIKNIGNLTWEQIEDKIAKIKREKIIIDIKANTEDTLKAIDSLDQNLDKIKGVFNDIQDGGAFDFGSIVSDDFKALFGDATDAYNSFLETVSNSPKDINAVKDAFDNLIKIQIDESGILDNVHDGNKKVIKSYLEEIGVINASEVTHQAYVNTKIKAFLAGRDLTNILPEEINAFLAENQVLGINEQMLNAVALAKTTLNGTFLNFSKDIDSIIGFVEKIGGATAALKMMNEVKKAGEYQNSHAWSGMGDVAAAAKKEVQDALNSIMNIQVATPKVNYSKFSPPKEKKEKKDTKTELEKEIELIEKKYDTEKAGIDDTIDYMDYLAKRIPENSEEMLKHNEDMLDILDKSIENRKGKLNALLSLDGIMDKNPELVYEVQKEIRDLETQQYEMKLSNIDLMVEVDKAKFSGVDEIVNQLENQLALAVANEDIDLQIGINTSLKENGMNQLEAVSAMIGKYKALRDLQKEGSQEYINLTKTINDLYKEQGSLIDDQIDKIKTLSKLQAEKDVYGTKGKDDWEKSQNDKIDSIKDEIEHIQNLNKEKEKENEIEKKKLEIQELEEKLKNLRENKDIKVLKKQDDGTWDWEYIENYKEIGEAEKDLNDSRLELEEMYEQQKLESKIEALEKQIGLLEKEKEDKNEEYELQLRDLEEKNRKELTETVTHFNNMKTESRTGLENLDKTVDTGLSNLYDTYDTWLASIYTKVKRYVKDIKDKLDEVGMTEVPSSISNSGSSSSKSSSSSSSKSSSKTSSNSIVGAIVDKVTSFIPTKFKLSYDNQNVGSNYSASMARTASYVPSVESYANNNVETVTNNNGDTVNVDTVKIEVNGTNKPIDVAKEVGSIISGLSNEARLKSAK